MGRSAKTGAPPLVIEVSAVTGSRHRIKLPAPVADIYRAVAELERLYPGRKFTPDGHLVGSIGEVIATEHFGLKLFPSSNPGHDAIDAEGRLVQIKLTAGNNVSMFADCERLIVLRVVSPEQAEIAYDGPGAPIWAAAGAMQKNGQRKIRLSRLRAIAANLIAPTPMPA